MTELIESFKNPYLPYYSSQLKETSQQPFIPDKNLTSALGTFQFWLTDMPQTFQELLA